MKTTLSEFPNEMKALVLKEYDKDPEVRMVKVPSPRKGQVLVKIDSSPINPSDLMFLQGLYTKKELPVIPGFEGSGTVVASGNDFFSKRLLGKKVACLAPSDGNGTWAEYMMTSYTLAVPLNKNMDIEQGSMLLVNPLSAVAMMKMTKKAKIKAIANTAAASALGQILNQLCVDEGITLVNIVRREEQATLLMSRGAKYVLNSSDSDFKDDMKKLFKELNVLTAFDAISGQGASDLLTALPRGGQVIIYGSLSQQPIPTDPRAFIFQGKKISGFWLSEWIKNQHILKLLSMFKKIQKFLTNTHQVVIHQRVSLEDAVQGVKSYSENMTLGKVLIKPWKSRM